MRAVLSNTVKKVKVSRLVGVILFLKRNPMRIVLDFGMHAYYNDIHVVPAHNSSQ